MKHTTTITFLLLLLKERGADTVTISASALPLDLLAKITGQYHDEATGMMVECERTTKYFAIGYKTEMTDGTPIFVWRLKGTFGIPDSTHVTKDNGTGANGQSVTYTGISTTHKFTKTGKEAKAVVVEISEIKLILANSLKKYRPLIQWLLKVDKEYKNGVKTCYIKKKTEKDCR